MTYTYHCATVTALGDLYGARGMRLGDYATEADAVEAAAPIAATFQYVEILRGRQIVAVFYRGRRVSDELGALELSEYTIDRVDCADC